MHDTKSQINNVCIIQQKENTENNNDNYNDNIEKKAEHHYTTKRVVSSKFDIYVFIKTLNSEMTH